MIKITPEHFEQYIQKAVEIVAIRFSSTFQKLPTDSQNVLKKYFKLNISYMYEQLQMTIFCWNDEL